MRRLVGARKKGAGGEILASTWPPGKLKKIMSGLFAEHGFTCFLPSWMNPESSNVHCCEHQQIGEMKDIDRKSSMIQSRSPT
jgi:hypothetical protein